MLRGRRARFILAAVAAGTFTHAFEAAAQGTTKAFICPLPKTSEEVLKTRLAVTEYVKLAKIGPLAAWAMRAGHGAMLDRWAKDRKSYAAQAKIFFGLAPLTQWLALGRSGSAQEIRKALGDAVVSKDVPATGLLSSFQFFLYADTPQGRKLVEVGDRLDRTASARQEMLRHVVLPSMLAHGRLEEALEVFPLTAEGFWSSDTLIRAGELDRAIELYRLRSQRYTTVGGQGALVIAEELLRAREIERLVAFLDAELDQVRRYSESNPHHEKGTWYWREPILTLLSRLGRTDWRPPDPLPASGPASTKVGAVASLIAALRAAGRKEDAERHRKKVHDHLEMQATELRERQKKREPPRVEHMFYAIPSPATFDVWIEIERAYALLARGDLENAEKIVRSLRGDRHARYSSSAVLSDLARYARQQARWAKAEELLTIAVSEPLFPQHVAPSAWLSAAADAQRAGETEMAARWMKYAGSAFCRLEPDRRQRFLSSPAGHPGDLKPFVIPYLDALYVLMGVREGQLPANARL